MNTSTFTFELPIDQEDIAVRLSPYSERGNIFFTGLFIDREDWDQLKQSPKNIYIQEKIEACQ